MFRVEEKLLPCEAAARTNGPIEQRRNVATAAANDKECEKEYEKEYEEHQHSTDLPSVLRVVIDERQRAGVARSK